MVRVYGDDHGALHYIVIQLEEESHSEGRVAAVSFSMWVGEHGIAVQRVSLLYEALGGFGDERELAIVISYNRFG